VSLTLGGALKAYLEGQGLGIAVYRDFEPTSASPPFVTIQEGLAAPAALRGDSTVAAVAELVQVDLWMTYVNASDGRLAESVTLPDALQLALETAVFPTSGANAPPKRVDGLTVDRGPRQADRQANLVHISYTATVNREI
jgi:hypothetical protein